MEEQKIDKRSKAYKEQVKNSAITSQICDQEMTLHNGKLPDAITPKTQLERLIENGIAVVKAEFQSAINNADMVPETHFSKNSDNKNRRVEMWVCAGGTLLICKHKTSKGEVKYFSTPMANVKYANFN